MSSLSLFLSLCLSSDCTFPSFTRLSLLLYFVSRFPRLPTVETCAAVKQSLLMLQHPSIQASTHPHPHPHIHMHTVGRPGPFKSIQFACLSFWTRGGKSNHFTFSHAYLLHGYMALVFETSAPHVTILARGGGGGRGGWV